MNAVILMIKNRLILDKLSKNRILMLNNVTVVIQRFVIF